MRHRPGWLWLLLALTGCGHAAPQELVVRPGIEVLLEDSTHLIAGRRVGILTNQTGIDRSGTSDVSRLLDAGAEVTAILSPEHGIRGVLDQEHIGHDVDPATGLTVYSLYRDGRVRAPTPEMLRDVDVVLADLQDIGARPYTFINAVLLTMRAAAAEGVAVIVLDRPNPIGGVQVQGPVLDTAFASSIGMLPVALRHGMTLGELARLGNDRLAIGADLIVVPAAGWSRDRWFDETGLPWVRPSPSMPGLESATHYPGLVLFEATNLSVGRGTPVAFQVIGAPWLDAAAVVRLMGAVDGAQVSDTVVRPESPPDGKYADQAIPAVRFRVTDRRRYDPVAAATAMLAAVLELHADSLTVREARLAQLAGTDALWARLAAGASAATIAIGWRQGLEEFAGVREGYLLY